MIEQNVVENEMLNEIDEPKVSIVDIEDEDRVKGDILYSVDEVPRWYLCILLGIQWKCPSEEEMLSATEEELQEIWQIRMREVRNYIKTACWNIM
ncbi:uncharacterized protein LOC143246494 isoform X4 [Tachypleus tridentatus]|uniref:uncharacterized protein LOC143246494 isoform X4 n=1 Tax=Tachypleus tridentatus TaxID=6853 RepID=UPI003FD3AAB9